MANLTIDQLEDITKAILKMRSWIKDQDAAHAAAVAPVREKLGILENYAVGALGDRDSYATSVATIKREDKKYAALNDWYAFIAFTFDIAMRESGLVAVLSDHGVNYDQFKSMFIDAMLEHGTFRYIKKEVKSTEVYAFVDLNATPPAGVSVGSRREVVIKPIKPKKGKS